MKDETFLDALAGAHDASASDEALTARLQGAIVAYGSATDDNMACASCLELGCVDTSWGRRVRGLKLREKNVLVSDVLASLEQDLPSSVRERIPELTEDQWAAAIRVALLAFTAFEEYADSHEFG